MAEEFAAGRIDQPYTDSDAAILENIYNLLTRIADGVDKANEHQHLSVANTAPTPTQAKIAQVLGLIDDTGRAEDTFPVKAKVPVAKIAQ